ncbi:MAG: YihY/virulence factor BrkB family protein [Bacteroidota bacterium]
MAKFLKKWFQIFKNSGIKFFEENPFKHSASTAYFTIFSLPAIGLVAITVAGYFYEDDVVRTQFLDQINQLMGESSSEQIDSLLSSATVQTDRVLFQVIGIGTLLFSATTVFISLQDSLNTIWSIKAKPKKGVVKFIINRLLSLAMIAALGFLLLVSLLADTVITFIQTHIKEILDGATIYIIQIMNIGISLGFITLVFAIIFKILPDAKLKWKDVWVGAFVTTVLFVAGKFALGFYLGTANLTDSYGAAGSFVAILVWVYYSVLILLFGAQVTFVYSKEMGRIILPKEGAVAVSITEVERERGKAD